MNHEKKSVSVEERINAQPAGLEANHKVQILLAQNNYKEAERMIDILKGFNIANDVFWVRNGEEALNFSLGRGFYADRSFSYQSKLILLDLHLPVINGLEVLKKIKSNTNVRYMPVFIFVSSHQEIDRLKALQPNNCTYIIKPINISKLKEAIWETEYLILPTFWEAREQHTLYQMD